MRARPRPALAAVLLAPLTFAAVASAGPVDAGPTERSVSRPSVAVEPPAAVTYRPPVAAPVGDPFRAPPTPYGAGNRGIEYATAPGEEVRVAAGGTVTFAGPVAGARYVAVLHADRARTSYGPLDDVAVAPGDQVAAGERVGTTAGPLLWTVRLGDAYLDPAVLLAASGAATAHLVPVPGGDDERN